MFISSCLDTMEWIDICGMDRTGLMLQQSEYCIQSHICNMLCWHHEHTDSQMCRYLKSVWKFEIEKQGNTQQYFIGAQVMFKPRVLQCKLLWMIAFHSTEARINLVQLQPYRNSVQYSVSGVLRMWSNLQDQPIQHAKPRERRCYHLNMFKGTHSQWLFLNQ